MTLVVGEILALRALDARDLVERDTLLSREAQRRRCRLTVTAERRGHRWTGDRLVEILLTLGDPCDSGRETPRSAEALDRCAGGDPKLFEARFQPLGQLLGCPWHPGRGQFFDADLYQ